MRLLQPYQLGSLTLKNRVVMAPMTRIAGSRARARRPQRRRTTRSARRAGLIVSEGTQVSELGPGYPGRRASTADEQVAGWRTVTDAVHAARRRDLRAAVARRPDRATRRARRRPPVGAVAPSRADGRDLHPRRACSRSRRRARWTLDEIAGVVEQFRTRRAQRDRGRLRRRRAARRQRLPARPVPARRHQPAHRRVRRHGREPRPLRCSRSRGGGRGDRRRPRRRAPLARRTFSDIERRRPGRRRSATLVEALDAATAWPTCTSSRPGRPADRSRWTRRERLRLARSILTARSSPRGYDRDSAEQAWSTDGARRPRRLRPPVPRQPGPARAACAPARPSTSPTRRPSTAAAPRATPTTRRSTRPDPALPLSGAQGDHGQRTDGGGTLDASGPAPAPSAAPDPPTCTSPSEESAVTSERSVPSGPRSSTIAGRPDCPGLAMHLYDRERLVGHRDQR